MKRRILLALAVLMMLTAPCALAAPQLTRVFADDIALISGQDGWYFEFNTTEGGTLAMQLLSGETGDVLCDLGTAQVEAGDGRIAWNGLMPDGSAVEPGNYMVAVQLRNFWGEESEQSLLSLHIYESETQADASRLDLTTLVADDALFWEEPAAQADGVADANSATTAENAAVTDAPAAQNGAQDAVPVATSFWDMNPDDYDLENPAHQQAIWDLMMQPITVLDVGQTEHVYPTNQPGIDRTPYEENCAGELHGQSQGVHVLEADTDGDGYVLIESYSNDGTKTDNAYMESIDAKRIQGYVKESLLFEVTPTDSYALLVDKLRQKLYIFQDGQIISTLTVSTGLNNEKQPYNETPAGEFITVSRVGDFNAGGGTIGRYAIRINGGTLLHEVLHEVGADGKTRIYSPYEEQLGQKASHGCIRIQRRENENGHNMAWLWNNLELKTKVFIWDDQGRKMYDPELPDPDLQLYRNPNGGSNYHLVAECPGVREQYLPLTGDRSALDAVELTNVGANYLREHVKSDVRIHYVITNGGMAPNIVPDRASVWYYVRAPKRESVEEVYDRLVKIAKGAAMMTETELEIDFKGGCYESTMNSVLADTLQKSLKECPRDEWTKEELEFAEEINKTTGKIYDNAVKQEGFEHLHSGVYELTRCGHFGSTDVGDVQHICPGTSFTTACYPICAPGHSWQITASSGSTIGEKGMTLAARAMALCALKVIEDPEILKKANEEFEKMMGGKKYVCPIPKDLPVPFAEEMSR